MELKNLLSMTVTSNARDYTLHMPFGAPHGEIYDALFQMLQRVVQESNAAVAASAPKSSPEPGQVIPAQNQ